ncbi:uncharacterized protein [Littorina saxatilis]|uniref:uncharacterized protein n=1 Tax=Littorina saxatilis TaxID=31220 RepID=UPI0038B433CF
MATEGPAPKRARSDSERRETLTCALCLDVFESPKMLPCHHTFCLKCLDGLTSHVRAKSFHCPQCRHKVVIPPGGVVAFQSNFYLPPEELDTARDRTQCLAHPNQELDMYCADCEVMLCAKCVLAAHKMHTTQDRAEAMQNAGTQLQEDEERLQSAVSSVIDGVSADQAELQAVQDKRAAVEGIIRRKHASLVAMVDMVRDDSLAGLHIVSEEIERRVSMDLTSKQSNLDQLCLLQQRLQESGGSGDDCRLLQVTKEMKEGWGIPHAVQDLTSPSRTWLHRPVLSSLTTDFICRRTIQAFFGTVVDKPMKSTAAEVTVREQFRCGKEGEDVEVFSLCPNEDGSKVCISFARRGLKEDAPIQKYDENGTHISTHGDATGRHSWKSRGAGKGMCAKLTQTCLQTYDKSQKKAIFKLVNDLSGTAQVNTSKVVSEDPFTVEHNTEFAIQVGAHRAFDVNANEELFVVVEEAQPGHVQRMVKLYRRGQQAPVAIYSPPAAVCWPSDACFFMLGGQEVVLIADEGMDCIHVAELFEVMGASGPVTGIRFERSLAPGCPLVVQPTALNIDSRDRLWVACRGGAILTCTPIA